MRTSIVHTRTRSHKPGGMNKSMNKRILIFKFFSHCYKLLIGDGIIIKVQIGTASGKLYESDHENTITNSVWFHGGPLLPLSEGKKDVKLISFVFASTLYAKLVLMCGHDSELYTYWKCPMNICKICKWNSDWIPSIHTYLCITLYWVIVFICLVKTLLKW